MAGTKRTSKAGSERRKVWPVDGLATIAEACEFLRIGRTTIYKLMNTDKLEWCRVAGDRRIPWSALRRFAT